MQAQVLRETARLAERLRMTRARVEEKAVAEGIAETVALDEGRGARFTPPARNGGVRRRKDGLDWLYDKGRISHRQKLAGEKYGDDWRKAQAHSPRSCLDPTVKGYHDGTPAEARTHAALRLARARALALNGNAPLAEAADRVCGETLKPIDWAEGDDRLAGRLEDRAQRALELLEAYYFG
jgi:hypothetical protein